MEFEDGQGQLFAAPRVPLGLMRWGVPPFNILDARAGYWRERKQQWLDKGIRSEIGRGEDLVGLKNAYATQQEYTQRAAIPGGGGGRSSAWYGKDAEGRTVRMGDAIPGGAGANSVMRTMERAGGAATGTSIFDPVLCELMYKWFCPAGGHVLDPFAGGSVRGIVAACTGRQYTGCELSGLQVTANEEQGATLDLEGGPTPTWRCGDSRDIVGLCPGAYDFILSCPPYTFLEAYSDDPRDLSTLPYPEFRLAYAEIVAKACSLLKPDRFAVFVVGEVRYKQGGGGFVGFVPDTVRAFEAAGLVYYNDAVYITPTGSLPVRAGKQFAAGRKLGRGYQCVLVFVKGDPRRATKACPVPVLDEVGISATEAAAYQEAGIGA